MKHRVLIASIRNSDFSEAARLAECLSESSKFSPVILDLNHNQIEIANHEKITKGLGLGFVTPRLRRVLLENYKSHKARFFSDSKLEQNNEKNSAKSFFVNDVKSKIRGLIGIPILFLVTFLDFSSLLRKLSPRLIVLPEDVVGVDTPLLIKLAQSRNIPCLIFPYTIANKSEAVESLKSLTAYNSTTIATQIVKKLFPKWHYRDANVSLIRLPIPYIICHEIFRLTPPNPWMMNSGYANKIAVESPKMLEFYLHEGFRRDRLALTGCLADDLQHSMLKNRANLKKELCNTLEIDESKPIILVAAPPNQLVAGVRPGFEFDNFRIGLKTVFRALDVHSKQYNIIVRPHPGHMDLEGCLEGTACKKITQDTALLIPLCDIYVAFASATIRWAITAGKPVLNYDIFQYNYEDYNAARAVITVKSLNDFESQLKKLCCGGRDYAILKQIQDECAGQWGMLDGLCGARLTAICEKLILETKQIRAGNTTVHRPFTNNKIKAASDFN